MVGWCLGWGQAGRHSGAGIVVQEWEGVIIKVHALEHSSWSKRPDDVSTDRSKPAHRRMARSTYSS